MANYRAMDGVAGRPGTGSSGTQPPAVSTSFTGWYGTGTAFSVTSTAWLSGYWWWVCPDGVQSAAAQAFALWEISSARYDVVPGSTITSGTLSAGWNYVPLAVPLLLTQAWSYRAATTLQNNFPMTAGPQFASGGPYAAGITNGPLAVYSDHSGTKPVLWANEAQSGFQTGGSDPAVSYPGTGNAGFLGWLDVQVTDTPPDSVAYSLFPNLPYADVIGTGDVGNGYTMAVQFSLSAACTLARIRFWSAPSAVVLPTRCGIWNMGSQLVVTGTDHTTPAWKRESTGAAASPGDGWIYSDYSGTGTVLAAGTAYKAAVFVNTGGGNQYWRAATSPFWASGGIYSAVGQNGITSGLITAPNTAGATPGQNSWHGPNLAWAYPDTYVNPENNWIDILVTPFGQAAPAIAAAAAPQPGILIPSQARPPVATAAAVAPRLLMGTDISLTAGPTLSRAQVIAAGTTSDDGKQAGPTTVDRNP